MDSISSIIRSAKMPRTVIENGREIEKLAVGEHVTLGRSRAICLSNRLSIAVPCGRAACRLTQVTCS